MEELSLAYVRAVASRAGCAVEQDLRNYLVARHWTQVPSRRDYVAIYRSPLGGKVEVQIPLDLTLADYVDAIMLAARRIAAFEQRASEQVLRDLLQPNRDIVRMTLGEADSYIAACRLGQTEIGSFVLTIDTPITLEKQLDATELPFGRRATAT